jgi:hypothetical protein
MAKSRRRQTKSKHRPTAMAARTGSPMRTQMRAPRRAAIAAQPEAVIAPVTEVTREVQSFGRRRLHKMMAASSRMMAARDMGDATVVQSQYMLDAIDDYLAEAARVAQIWMQAVGRNWSVLDAAGGALGRDMSRRVKQLQSLPVQAASDLAMTSSVVH